VVKFIDAIAEKTLRKTVTMMAARGRGKSAALGLAIAGAVAMGSVSRSLRTPLQSLDVKFSSHNSQKQKLALVKLSEIEFCIELVT